MSRVRLVRTLFAVVPVALFAFASSYAAPPQTPTSQTQGAAYLQKALASLAPTTPISDITLSGTVRRIAGSDDESGTIVFKALAGSGSRLDLTLPSGPRSEVRNTSSPEIAGSWSGPDGVPHPAAYHNLLTDPGWSPAFTIASLLSAQNAVISYVGAETRNGQSVIHVSASQQFPTFPADAATLMQHLTQIDIFLDASTGLPAAIAFNTHADNNANLDIPIELRFSSYAIAGGARIPFHVQKFLNNSLALDLQISSAILNSGLGPSTFAVGGAQ